MVSAYILIGTKAGGMFSIHKDLEDELDIQEAFPILGDFDAIARVDVKNLDALYTDVLLKFAEMSKEGSIQNTTTFVVIKELKKKDVEGSPYAYSFLRVLPYLKPSVNEDLMKLPFIRRSSLILGIYDILCEIDAKNNKELKEHLQAIQGIYGVQRSSTSIVLV